MYDGEVCNDKVMITINKNQQSIELTAAKG